MLLAGKDLKQCDIGRRGILHTGSLHRLSVGNPRIFRKERKQPGLNTAVHILLDVSGSMCGRPVTLAKEVCYAITKALEHIRGVNPAVTAFPAATSPDSVFPVIKHGQKVTDLFDMSTSGSTPLGAAFWWVLQNMLPLQEQRKIVFIITDGIPDDQEVAECALKHAQQLGFEVYGIGIRDERIKYLLPHTSRVITELPSLAPAMFAMLQDAFLKGRAS